MQVLDHEPHAWFLLSWGAELLLDVNVSHGAVSTSVTMALDADERAALDHEGRGYLSRLAQEVQDSIPLRADAGSPYRPRDLSPTLGRDVTQAVLAWRAGREEPG
jgi:hypothetical protein